MSQRADKPIEKEPFAITLGTARLSWIAVFGLAFGFTLLLMLGGALGGRLPHLQALLGGVMQPTELQLLLAALASAAEVMAAVLAIAITVVAIVVELAANRYSHRVTTLFLRDSTNVAVLSLFTLTTVYCVWLGVFADGPVATGAVWPGASLWLALLLVTMSLLLLLPYFAFVLAFIAPLNIIARLTREAELTFAQPAGATTTDKDIIASRRNLGVRLEDLHDVMRKAVEQSDRTVAMACANAIFALMQQYQGERARLPDAWFDMSAELRSDADFVAMEADALGFVVENGLWLELKMYRQLTAAVGYSLAGIRDLASLIAINTRLLGSRFGAQDQAFLRLSIHAFNSYLRASINAGDPRSGYYLFSQYRMLAESLLGTANQASIIEIAGYYRYYGQLAVTKNQPFLLEVAAYDVVHLIQACHLQDEFAELTDALLEILLDLDIAILNPDDEPRLIGIRRAQLQLATRLLAMSDEPRARRIAQDLAAESPQRLANVSQALQLEDQQHFHELTERGINFSYLAEQYRPYLAQVLAMAASHRQAEFDSH